MDKLLKAASKAQLPVAAVLAVVLAYDLVLRQQTGEGLAPDLVMHVVTFVLGAVGIARPSEVAKK